MQITLHELWACRPRLTSALEGANGQIRIADEVFSVSYWCLDSLDGLGAKGYLHAGPSNREWGREALDGQVALFIFEGRWTVLFGSATIQPAVFPADYTDDPVLLLTVSADEISVHQADTSETLLSNV